MYISMCVGTNILSHRTKVSSFLFQSAGEGLKFPLWLGFFTLTLWPWSWTFTVQHTIYVKCEYFMNQEE